MSYYVKAYKGRNKLNIPVEEKHKYYSSISDHEYYDLNPVSSETTSNLSLIMYQSGMSSGAGYQAYYDSNLNRNCMVLWNGNTQMNISQGTAEDQRIGDKIYLKSLQMLINIQLKQPALKFFNSETFDSTKFSSVIGSNYYTFQDILSGESITPAKFKFRLMLVRFEDTDFQDTSINDWFNTTFVPQYYIGQYINDSAAAVTNQSKMLRESTVYTGKFKILADRSFTLNSKKGHKFVKFDWNFKQNLTLNDNNVPTNDDFKGLRLLLFGPALMISDINGIAFSKMAEFWEKSAGQSNAAILRGYVSHAFTVQMNKKFTYYDM